MILRPGQAGSRRRAADDEAAGGVDQVTVSVSHAPGSTGLMISSITASMNSAFIVASHVSGACWLDSTTVSMATGLPST